MDRERWVMRNRRDVPPPNTRLAWLNPDMIPSGGEECRNYVTLNREGQEPMEYFIGRSVFLCSRAVAAPRRIASLSDFPLHSHSRIMNDTTCRTAAPARPREPWSWRPAVPSAASRTR